MRVAYACFAWLAVVPWIEPVLEAPLFPFGLGPMLLTVLSVPIALATVGAVGLSVAYSVRERHERGLLAMSVIAVGMALLFVAVDEFGDLARETATWGYRVGSFLLVVLCARWVLARRTFG